MNDRSAEKSLNEVVAQLLKLYRWQLGQAAKVVVENEAELADWLIFIKRICLVNQRLHKYLIEKRFPHRLLCLAGS